MHFLNVFESSCILQFILSLISSFFRAYTQKNAGFLSKSSISAHKCFSNRMTLSKKENLPLSFLFLPASDSRPGGSVLPRRPVMKRRHLGRVLCGLTCPLRFIPIASAAAAAIRTRLTGPSEPHPKTSPAEALPV